MEICKLLGRDDRSCSCEVNDQLLDAAGEAVAANIQMLARKNKTTNLAQLRVEVD